MLQKIVNFKNLLIPLNNSERQIPNFNANMTYKTKTGINAGEENLMKHDEMPSQPWALPIFNWLIIFTNSILQVGSKKSMQTESGLDCSPYLVSRIQGGQCSLQWGGKLKVTLRKLL